MFNHRNTYLDNKKYRNSLYYYSDPSECTHDNANLRVNCLNKAKIIPKA